MEKHIIERIMEIENCAINEIDDCAIENTHIATIELAGTIGQYHFWVDLGGFCRGDATDDDIERDCKLLNVSDEDWLYSHLNDMFIEEFKKHVN
jgi:hypothetical protein